MAISAALRVKRYRSGRSVFDDLAARGNTSVSAAVASMSKSSARDSLRVHHNNQKRELNKMNEENAFIQKARTSFKRDQLYKRKGEDKGYGKPGDSTHKTSLKQKVARMTGFKKKMFQKAYDDYDSNNQRRRMNPVVKNYSDKHDKEYGDYTDSKLHNG